MKCPKCNSDQVSAQKKGFSGGKAVAGVVLAGGVGVLAGLHGKDNIELHCLSCGNVWKPKDDLNYGKPTYTTHDGVDLQLRKKWFYSAYEGKNKRDALQYIPSEKRLQFERDGLDGVYKSLKDDDKAATQFMVIIFGVVAFLIAIIYWIFS